jgi:hypothetical protein
MVTTGPFGSSAEGSSAGGPDPCAQAAVEVANAMRLTKKRSGLLRGLERRSIDEPFSLGVAGEGARMKVNYTPTW